MPYSTVGQGGLSSPALVRAQKRPGHYTGRAAQGAWTEPQLQDKCGAVPVLMVTLMSLQDTSGSSQDLCPFRPFCLSWGPRGSKLLVNNAWGGQSST